MFISPLWGVDILIGYKYKRISTVLRLKKEIKSRRLRRKRTIPKELGKKYERKKLF